MLNHSQLSPLLFSILEESGVSPDNRLANFLTVQSDAELLKNLVLLYKLPESIKSKTAFLRFLSAQIAQIDDLVNQQLNALLHHPKFQQLESSWLGLKLLVKEVSSEENIKIRLLNIDREEMNKDLSKPNFDQSELFHKIYSQEFDSPGGYPFGLMLGDYYFDITGPNAHKDLNTLTTMAQIATASFCPFIASISPLAFHMDSFFELNLGTAHIEKMFKSPEYNRWNTFRKNPDSRFVGLTLPRVLMRKPYQNKLLSHSSFCFEEDNLAINNKNYLWGNACFAFALVAIRSYLLSGWFGEIRGIKNPTEGGGIVSQLPNLNSDNKNLVATCGSIETNIDEKDESFLSDCGLIPLCVYGSHKEAVYYSSMSAYSANKHLYDNSDKISSMLQYLLCASRFAHYIKIIGRDKIGSFNTAQECTNFLNKWLSNYIASNEVGESLRRRFPLQGAKVEVKEIPGKPGVFNCIMHLQPRYQLEKVNTALTLITELAEISSH